MSQKVLYFLHSTSVLSSYIDVVLILSIHNKFHAFIALDKLLYPLECGFPNCHGIFLKLINIWNVNCVQATGFIFDTWTDVLVKVDRKCLDLRGTRTPNLRIHAHRGEAIYISVIDFQWYSAQRNGFQWFSHSSFDYDYMHQLYLLYLYQNVSILLHFKPV